MLISDNIVNVQTMLSSIESIAAEIGLRINVSKTEFLLVGIWKEAVTISLSSGPIKKVDDFKYLGSWLMDSVKDFEVRKALAWKACIRLKKIWKSRTLSRKVKINLFLACVESTLLYNVNSMVALLNYFVMH